MGEVSIRPAVGSDAASIGTIWWTGWRDGHVGNVPDALVALRTEESFTRRAQDRVGDATVAVVDGAVAGFVMVDGDEVEQVFVAAEHRGTKVARRLLAAAESIVAGSGYPTAWLAVVEGNARARRFYERSGWSNAGPIDYVVEDRGITVDVPTLRYEKPVTP